MPWPPWARFRLSARPLRGRVKRTLGTGSGQSSSSTGLTRSKGCNLQSMVKQQFVFKPVSKLIDTVMERRILGKYNRFHEIESPLPRSFKSKFLSIQLLMDRCL